MQERVAHGSAMQAQAGARDQAHRSRLTTIPAPLTRGSSPPMYSANQAPNGRGLAGSSRGPLCSRWYALLLPAPLSSVLPCHLRHSQAPAGTRRIESRCGGAACSVVGPAVAQGERQTVGRRGSAAAARRLWGAPKPAHAPLYLIGGLWPVLIQAAAQEAVRSRVTPRGRQLPQGLPLVAARVHAGWARRGCHRSSRLSKLPLLAACRLQMVAACMPRHTRPAPSPSIHQSQHSPVPAFTSHSTHPPAELGRVHHK